MKNTAFSVVDVSMLRVKIVALCSMFPVQLLKIAQSPCPMTLTVDIAVIVG